MRYIDNRHPKIFMNMLDFILHMFAKLFVERTKRFIHQNQFRIKHQCPGQRDPLLLSTRQLRRFPIDKGKHLNHVQHCANFVFDFGRWHIAHFQRKSQIFTHRHMREQGVILKHHANTALMRRNVIDWAAA